MPVAPTLPDDTLLDLADDLVRRSQAPAFDAVRTLAARVHFPLQPHLDRLAALTERALAARAARDHTLALTEVADDHAEVFVARVDGWFRQFRAVARLLRATQHPSHPRFASLASLGDDKVDSLREAELVLERVLGALGELDDPTSVYLDAAFLAEGTALLRSFSEHKDATAHRAADRMALTQTLTGLVDEVRELLDLLTVVADMIEARTGTRPLALDPTPTAAVREPSPRPPPPLSPVPGLPALEPIPGVSR